MHTGHRKRMRDRYEKDGFENFQDHELLESALFPSIKRGNTNDTGHRLLETFGSVKNVFEADYDALRRVEGVGDCSAYALKVVLELFKRYEQCTHENVTRYTRLTQIAAYCFNKYIGVTREQLYVMFFNNRMNLLDCVMVSEGSVTSTGIPINRINDLIVQKKAAAVVLAHNHPDGLAVPSQNDMEVTDTVRQLLESIDVTLVEHLIIADNSFYPIMKHRYGLYRTSPINNRVECGFYELFYDVDDKDFSFPKLFADPAKPEDQQ